MIFTIACIISGPLLACTTSCVEPNCFKHYNLQDFSRHLFLIRDIKLLRIASTLLF